ncbi:hypothetical protein TOPH_05001 [Tolypocladium ophioglossoides CBS 100239]|uniref:Methyltransferase domain-containing protein n=1 Tax=Tolypocladium ophioglossoides (strain CBS 100239) TaxID=1163406 RepID=A0A0L0N8T3_TOLOC|nr:hypothetical protein TOPH_05001 [Tolypocladium ophioglossoides CBS 100239]
MCSTPQIRVIETDRFDPYQDKVVRAYDDPPEMWHKVLGKNLSFQFGLFDEGELADGPEPGPVGPSEFRHFDRQLELAGLLAPNRSRINRILDLGCGWGHITCHMAALFPECPCIDGVNISQCQLEYFADNLSEDLGSRVNLYFCNGQDVDLLPRTAVPYDLVIVRGVYTHFLPDVFEASVAQVAQRLSHNGTLIISDTLYKVSRPIWNHGTCTGFNANVMTQGDLSTYKSAIHDTADRLACGNRKSPEYYASVLEKNGLKIQDMRIMPSNAEVMYWFEKVRLNIEQNFLDGAPGPIQELHEMAISFSRSLAANKASVYSIISRRVQRN